MEIVKDKTYDLWRAALDFVKTEGVDYRDNEGRTCREVSNLVLVLKNSVVGVDVPIDTMKKSKKWIYPSKDELSNIMFKEIQVPIYEYTYGGRIFNFAGQLDQINEFIVPLLRNDSSSRRAVIIVYDPMQDSQAINRNTPSIIYLNFRIKDHLLHLSAHIRSNDLFFGFPSNIYQLAKLLDFVSKELGVANGSISIISNSAHLFLEDLQDIEEVLI
ncbi:thymidylate synthase [Candidatus Woesearchaeota archaeon]|nr:thymidylate synthase [Candidatus Woesearchaeota archaeon]